MLFDGSGGCAQACFTMDDDVAAVVVALSDAKHIVRDGAVQTLKRLLTDPSGNAEHTAKIGAWTSIRIQPVFLSLFLYFNSRRMFMFCVVRSCDVGRAHTRPDQGRLLGRQARRPQCCEGGNHSMRALFVL